MRFGQVCVSGWCVVLNMAVRLLDAAEPYLYVKNAISFPTVAPPKYGDPEPVLLRSAALVLTVGLFLENYVDAKISGRSVWACLFSLPG